MLTALRDTGWHAYTLHLGEDGLLAGVLETDDFDGARAAMDATEVNTRWQAEMAPFFADLADGRADDAMRVLPTVFDLDEQLRQLET